MAAFARSTTCHAWRDCCSRRENHGLVLPQTKTPGIEEITWGSLAEDDPDYQIMERKKEAAKQGQREYSDSDGDSDDNVGMSKAARDRKIKQLYDQGIAQKKIAAAFDLTQQSVSKVVND